MTRLLQVSSHTIPSRSLQLYYSGMKLIVKQPQGWTECISQPHHRDHRTLKMCVTCVTTQTCHGCPATERAHWDTLQPYRSHAEQT